MKSGANHKRETVDAARWGSQNGGTRRDGGRPPHRGKSGVDGVGRPRAVQKRKVWLSSRCGSKQKPKQPVTMWRVGGSGGSLVQERDSKVL